MSTQSLIGGTTVGAARYITSPAALLLLLAAMSAGLFWLVWIYGNGLRDARYFDGWVLAGGMGLQLCFHIAVKTARMKPKSIVRWRKAHIFSGYLLIAAFVSHSNFSWPDTLFEWALWSGFMLVTLTGIFGTYLAWSLKAKRGIDEHVGFDRIEARRAELMQAVQAIVAMTDQDPVFSFLPAPPYRAWIADLYTAHLRTFFQGRGHIVAHLTGSQRPLRRLTSEIDNLSRYVDKKGQEKLEAIKILATEKDKLDFAAVHSSLSKGWLFVHVPATYALFVLTAAHILVVYAFSSGDW